MKGYSHLECFSHRELALLDNVRQLVECFPDLIDGHWVRCHELARVIGETFGLTVQDGHYGMVEHSWLLTEERNILDPYVVGRLPQVQLIDSTGLLPEFRMYRVGKAPADIFERDIQVLKDAVDQAPCGLLALS